MVRVDSIASYSDRDGIAAAVSRAFDRAPDVCVALEAASAERLCVVKPNWIQESHQHEADVWECVITHPAVILAVLQELASRMQGIGTIALCDAPHTYADFDAILARGELAPKLAQWKRDWPEMTLECIDLRREIWTTKDDVIVSRRKNAADPRGYTQVNLAEGSLFFGHAGEGRYYGADYDTEEVNRRHRGRVQEYLLSGTAVRADVFINLPKLKTHKKTGITCCLKNLVGINGDKNWLPHHCEGTPATGGDEFPDSSLANSLERAFKRVGRKAALSIPVAGTFLFRHLRSAGKELLGDSEQTIRNGNWHGNDTCWRMALDLNRALLYANPDGTLRGEGERKPYLAIVDGIVAGEGNGPIAPCAVDAGVLISSDNPAEADACAARLMGFDVRLLPIVEHAFDAHALPIAGPGLGDVRVEDGEDQAVSLADISPAGEPFEPHFGWSTLRAPAGT